MNKIQISALLLSFLICCLAQFSLAQEREKALDNFFSMINRNGEISGSVLVAENGKVLYQKSFGYADAQHKIPNTANTLFQIASVSKLFTSIAVLQLYERKKLDLTEKFIKYFPDFPYPDVTIKQLLSNTSGIPDVGDVFVPLWKLNKDTIFTLNDIIPALRSQKLPLGFKPGEGWDYSNTNYSLLALLVEKVSGEKYADYLSKKIFIPAGMKSTFQQTSGTNPYTHPNVAFNYAWPFISSMSPARVDSFAINDYKVHYKTWPSEGDGNIYASTSDLMNFNESLNNERLLKQKTLGLLFIPSTRNNGKKFTLNGVESEIGVIGDFYWGFGNRIDVDSTFGKIVWESGGKPGCRANIIQNLTRHQLLIWLDNKESPSAMDNIFGALYIVNGRTAAVKKAKQQAAAHYARSLISEGEDAAFARLIAMAPDTTNYSLTQNEMNDLGYEFFNNQKTDLALQTFRAAVYVFPNSDNLFNSYGEILAKSGRKEAAIIMYKRSVLLNPKNDDSKKSLADLEKK
ncbi:serine hydrolase [Mucilaginibacter sp. BJC16-A38]|uniref:serine hydrolase n=1 Tax=Mucilaginibacter phenanthrenivorans TaxID=1234842 RepID=UPI002158332A|nr:serine hydrolase [Mucilaginibacter phenanthrenivorans]MCR8557244.1 serine hydrolase [Mucilaginibacter phenanthrenivorans]